MGRVVDARACVTSRIVAVLATELAARFCLNLDETWDFEAGDSLSVVGNQLGAGVAFATSDGHHGVDRLSEALVRDADHRGRVEPLSAHASH